MFEAIKFIGPVILMVAGIGILHFKKLKSFRQKHKSSSIDLAVCLIMLGIMLEIISVIQYFAGSC